MVTVFTNIKCFKRSQSETSNDDKEADIVNFLKFIPYNTKLLTIGHQ